jgi:hypothetical protein
MVNKGGRPPRNFWNAQRFVRMVSWAETKSKVWGIQESVAAIRSSRIQGSICELLTKLHVE